MNKRICFILALSAIIVFISCRKETDSYSSEPINAYIPLQVGKYITYRLDSLKFISFGQKDTIVSYQARDKVEDSLIDNIGRKAFRIVRYQRAFTSINEADWTPVLTYFIVPTRETVELIENNFRYQKLKLPLKEGFSWRGNTFLPGNPYEYFSPFSNDEDMPYWDYTYQDVDVPLSINNLDFDSTISVHQIEDSVNVPITQPDGLAYRNYWIETYAKNVGLIYREVVMWEYQPPNGSNPGYKTGFGIKMSIIDHN
ncbi:MAG TPA: hypothetical protein VM012_13535 [Flavitalea sp.]|nr:hypothetical protein [Flavitalea sp.]